MSKRALTGAAQEASPVGLAMLVAHRNDAGEITDFAYTYASPAGATLLGRDAESLVGERMLAVEPDAIASGKFDALREALSGGAPIERAFPFRRNGVDGLEHVTIVAVGPVLAVTFTDVTEWSRARAEVARLRSERARAERRAARVLEQVSDAHVTLDHDFITVTVNPAAERLLAHAASDLLGRRYWDVAAVSASTQMALRDVVATQRSAHFTEDVTRSGGDLHLEVDAYPTDDHGVAVVWRDATARVASETFQREFTAHLASWNARLQASAAERELLLAESERARRELEDGKAERARLAQAEHVAKAALEEAESARAAAEAANRAKTEFLATMSHELRTPLNAIGGYAELIALGLRGPVSDEQRADLVRIQRSQRHLLGLINEVLDHARLESGITRFATMRVSLRETIEAAEALLGPQARAKGVTLRVGECDDSVRALADPDRAPQIVVNLLSNAVKFTGPGGAVVLECAHDEEFVRLTVTDTGRGIAEEQLARIFEPFVQVDSRLARTEEGLGLGLSISRDLARRMGGDLQVTSEVSVGSTFTLTLPFAPKGDELPYPYERRERPR